MSTEQGDGYKDSMEEDGTYCALGGYLLRGFLVVEVV